MTKTKPTPDNNLNWYAGHKIFKGVVVSNTIVEELNPGKDLTTRVVAVFENEQDRDIVMDAINKEDALKTEIENLKKLAYFPDEERFIPKVDIMKYGGIYCNFLSELTKRSAYSKSSIAAMMTEIVVEKDAEIKNLREQLEVYQRATKRARSSAELWRNAFFDQKPDQIEQNRFYWELQVKATKQ